MPRTGETKGKFRIDTLAANLHEGGSAGYWHEVLDQLNEGEMPPEDETQLTETELNRFTTWLESGLKQAAAKRSSTGGRHLSRYEPVYTGGFAGRPARLHRSHPRRSIG